MIPKLPVTIDEVKAQVAKLVTLPENYAFTKIYNVYGDRYRVNIYTYTPPEKENVFVGKFTINQSLFI